MKRFAAQRSSANGKAVSMGRAKIVIKPIQNEHQRQTTFTKRKRGLKKKVEELSVLCGVDICLLCYSNATSEKPSNMFWGSPGVEEVIARYHSLSKEDRDKKKLDNTGLLEALVKKHGAELKQMKEANFKLQQERGQDERAHQVLSQCSLQELHNLAAEIQDKKRKVLDRLGLLATPGNSIASSSCNLEGAHHPVFLEHTQQQQACGVPAARHWRLAGNHSLELNRNKGNCSNVAAGPGQVDFPHMESSVDSSVESSSVSSGGMQLHQPPDQQGSQQLRMTPNFLSLDLSGSCLQQEVNCTDSAAVEIGHHHHQHLPDYSHVELVPFLPSDYGVPSFFSLGTSVPQPLLGFFPFPLNCDQFAAPP